jgi:hypothetical protein
MVRRGRVRIAITWGLRRGGCRWAATAAVLAASSPGVTLDGDAVTVPAATFTVIEV